MQYIYENVNELKDNIEKYKEIEKNESQLLTGEFSRDNKEQNNLLYKTLKLYGNNIILNVYKFFYKIKNFYGGITSKFYNKNIYLNNPNPI
jgi:hypothetical protein